MYVASTFLKTKKYLLIWVILLQGICANASLRWYSPANGLPERVICSISFDKEGTCWVGAQTDIYLFNGKSFFSYRNFLDENPRSNSSYFHVLAANPKTLKILVASNSELFSLEPSKTIKGKLTKTTQYQNTTSAFHNFYISKDSVLYGWNESTYFFWRLKEEKPIIIKHNGRYTFHKGTNGKLYFESKVDFGEFVHGKPITIGIYTPKQKATFIPSTAGFLIGQVLFGKKEILNNLKDFNLTLEEISNIIRAQGAKWAPGGIDYRAFSPGPDSSIWFATINGLIIYQPSSKRINGFVLPKSCRGIVHDSITGKTAFVFYNGFAIFNKEGKLLKQVNLHNIYFNEGVLVGHQAIFLPEGEQKKILIIDFQTNGYQITEFPLPEHPLGIKFLNKQNMLIGGDSLIYFSVDKNGLFSIQKSINTKVSGIKKIVFLPEGDVLLVVQTGLFHFNPVNNKLTLLSNHSFKTIVWDGKKWIAITDAGMLVCGDRKKILFNTQLNQRLLFKQVYEMIHHPKTNTLWLASDNGIFLISSDLSKPVLRLSEEDGFYSNEFNTFSALSSKNTLFAGGLNGVNYFEPQNYLVKKSARLCFYEKINNLGELDFYYICKKDSQLNFQSNQNNIRLYLSEFGSGQSFIHITEKEGNTISGSRFENKIELYGLPWGEHQFAISQAGLIEDMDVQNINISIAFPWYLRWPFLIFLSLLIVLGIKAIIEIRRKILKAQYVEQIEINRKDMYMVIAHDLKSPMNSFTHLLKSVYFLLKNKRYNDLSLIEKELIHTSESVQLILSNLLGLGEYENNNDNNLSVLDMNEFSTELDRIYRILSETKNITFTIKISPCPPLIIDHKAIHLVMQNLIDNAIKHGCLFVKVRFSFFEKRSLLIIEVSNSIHQEQLIRTKEIINLLKHKKNINPGEIGNSLGVVILSKYFIQLKAKVSLKIKPKNEVQIKLAIPVEIAKT